MTVAEQTKADIEKGRSEAAKASDARDTLARVSSLVESMKNNPMMSPETFEKATAALNNAGVGVPIAESPVAEQPISAPISQPTIAPTTPVETPQSQPMVIPRADSNYNPKKSKGIAMATFN